MKSVLAVALASFLLWGAGCGSGSSKPDGGLGGAGGSATDTYCCP